MRVRKNTIDGFELELTLGDLRPAFFRQYAEWLADMRELPDPDDEIEASLRGLGWPSLGVLLEVAPDVFALVLLVLGDEVLADLDHRGDPLEPVRVIPSEIVEVEVRGRKICVRGTVLVAGLAAGNGGQQTRPARLPG
jgi:hypothetical protein